MNESFLRGIMTYVASRDAARAAMAVLGPDQAIACGKANLLDPSEIAEWLKTKPTKRSLQFVAERADRPDVLAALPRRHSEVITALSRNRHTPASVLAQLAARALKCADMTLACDIARNPNTDVATLRQLASMPDGGTLRGAYHKYVLMASLLSPGDLASEIATLMEGNTDLERAVARNVSSLVVDALAVYAAKGYDVQDAIATLWDVAKGAGGGLAAIVASIDDLRGDTARLLDETDLVRAAEKRVNTAGTVKWKLPADVLARGLARDINGALLDVCQLDAETVPTWIAAVEMCKPAYTGTWRKLLAVSGELRPQVAQAMLKLPGGGLDALDLLDDADRAAVLRAALAVAPDMQPTTAKLLLQAVGPDRVLELNPWPASRTGTVLASLGNDWVPNPEQLTRWGHDTSSVLAAWLSRIVRISREQVDALTTIPVKLLHSPGSELYAHIVAWMNEHVAEEAQETFVRMLPDWEGSLADLAAVCREMT